MNSRQWFLAAAVVVLALGGCSSPAPTTPTAPPERFGAPDVDDPRDVRRFAAEPCSGPLSRADLVGFGFRAQGEAETLPEGSRSCDWNGDDGLQNLSVTLVTTRDILADVYGARQFALFRPTTADGLPAVAEQSYPGSISCTITVGTAETQGFVVIFDGVEGIDPCERAGRIAERVVDGLPFLSEK